MAVVPHQDDSLITSRAECRELQEIANHELQRNGRDALAAFLTIHRCICEKKTGAKSPHGIAALNRVFAERCVSVYRAYRSGDYREIPQLWVRAFYAYERDQFDLTTVLPRMALAHILEDLEFAISAVGIQSVTKSDYDAVLDDILSCLNKTRKHFGVKKSLRGRVQGFLNQILAPGEKLTIRKLRNITFETARQRASLKGC